CRYRRSNNVVNIDNECLIVGKRDGAGVGMVGGKLVFKQGAAALDVPPAQIGIIAPRDEGASVRSKGQCAAPTVAALAMSGQAMDLARTGSRENSQRIIEGGYRQQFTVRRERQAAHPRFQTNDAFLFAA